MNRTLLLLLAVLGSGMFASAQIPNNDFEFWGNDHSSGHTYYIPQHWVTSDMFTTYIDSISGSQVIYHGTSVWKTSTSHSGSYAAQMQTTINGLDTVAGFVVSGDSISYLFSSGKQPGFPYTIRSAYLDLYYQFTSVGGDSMFVGVALTKWNTVSQQRDNLVQTVYFSKTNAISYTPLSIQLLYQINTEYPDTAYILAGMRGPNQHKSHVGTQLLIDGMSFSGTVALGIEEHAFLNDKVHIYPNPFDEEASFRIDSGVQLENASLRIVDLPGQQVREITGINSNEVKLSKGDLSPGIYFYQLVGKTGILAQGKFIIR